MQFGGTVESPYVQLELADNPLNVVLLYSEWIRWLHSDRLARFAFPPAFRPLGGDLKTLTSAVDKVVFLQPEWEIRLAEADQTLDVVGELYPEGGAGDVFAPTVGQHRVLIRLVVPQHASLQLVSSGSGLDATQAQQLAAVAAQVPQVASAVADVASDVTGVATVTGDIPTINERVRDHWRSVGLDPSNPVRVDRDDAGNITAAVAIGVGLDVSRVPLGDGTRETWQRQ